LLSIFNISRFHNKIAYSSIYNLICIILYNYSLIVYWYISNCVMKSRTFLGSASIYSFIVNGTVTKIRSTDASIDWCISYTDAYMSYLYGTQPVTYMLCGGWLSPFVYFHYWKLAPSISLILRRDARLGCPFLEREFGYRNSG